MLEIKKLLGHKHCFFNAFNINTSKTSTFIISLDSYFAIDDFTRILVYKPYAFF